MRFRDIPQFTSEGNYQVDVPLDLLKQKIESWQAEMGLQLDPDFQRGRVWTEEQQIKFVEYLLRGGKSARIIYFNHTDWDRLQGGEFVVVDGLQRLTALMRFLNNEIPAFGYYYREFEDKPDWTTTMTFKVNNLKTRAEVLQWYIDLNEGGTPHTEEEIERVKNLLRGEIEGQ